MGIESFGFYPLYNSGDLVEFNCWGFIGGKTVDFVVAVHCKKVTDFGGKKPLAEESPLCLHKGWIYPPPGNRGK